MWGIDITCILLVFVWGMAAEGTLEYNIAQPLSDQNLSKCGNGNMIRKKTEKKGIVCPMVKDEKGFLSEWVAFYEVQGFDKVIFYDNNSTEDFSEVASWIADGMVEIKRKWWVNDLDVSANTSQRYDDLMKLKALAEIDCKTYAAQNGYEIFVSVDLDEYIFPTNVDTTVVDELASWFENTSRYMALLPKYQFPATPHIAEPVQLLTIEAYQTRVLEKNKMNYYRAVAEKVALRLNGGRDATNNTQSYLIHCCDLHNCDNFFKIHAMCDDASMQPGG
jgi:hypothetical protein